MNRDLKCVLAVALLSAVAVRPASAQQVGQGCTVSTDTITTTRSAVLSQGVLECIPDGNGKSSWQAMGAGIARYDTSSSCTIAGGLRWNGSAVQYCNGSSWQSFGTSQTLVTGGCQTSWSGCPSGYHATSYFSPGTYNCCDKCGNPSWKYTVCSQ